MTSIIAPQPTADDRHFWEGLRAGTVLLQRCSDCKTMRHPPRPMCPRCQSLAWETFPSVCKGTLLSWIIPRHPPLPEGEELLVGLVETDEGARLVLNLVDFPEGVQRNDARVEIFTREVADGVVLPAARPLAAAEN